jgi:hypothetical protein
VPFTREQFRGILKELKPVLRPDLIRIVLDGNRIVAFIITIVDLNPSIQALDGRLSLWNQLRLYHEARFKPVRKVKTVLLAVDRNYQRRRLHDAMILDTYVHLIRTQPQLEVGDCSLICETLGIFIRSLERYGAERYKTYRIYEKGI